MGMFDWYIPEPPLSCLVCSKNLSEGQGKNSDCILFVWKQGFAHPIEHQGGGKDFQIDESDLKNFTLPNEFSIYSYDCGCPFPVKAICRTKDEVWIPRLLRQKMQHKGKQKE